jgi:PilZ domain-containing protein
MIQTNKRPKARKYRKERAVRRCPFVAAAEVTDLGSNTRLSGRTSELGVGGCYVDALNPFPEGTAVQLKILRDQGVFETPAKVVYCHPKFGMGLSFGEMTPEHRLLLETWLVELITQLNLTL